MADATHVSKLVRDIVEGLVDNPEQVTIHTEDSLTGIIIHVQTAPEDCGKVIGKAGRTARSIRTVLGGIARKNGHSITLNIAEYRSKGDNH